MLGPALQRIRRAVSTIPTASHWLECALGAAVLAALAPLGFASGLLTWAPRSADEIALIAATALFIPALGEELFFRGLLIPDRIEAPSATGAIMLSTALFPAWHVAETLWLVGARSLFLRVDFLIAAALLGLVCAILRRRSGSIWTAVALHWALVVVWQGWLGGASLAELR